MEEVPGFALQVTESSRGPVVLLAGELDLAAASEFRERLQRLSGENVTLDFTDVTFMDSTALGVLMAARNRAARDGGAIVLHGVRPAQMRIFEITGLAGQLDFDGDSASR